MGLLKGSSYAPLALRTVSMPYKRASQKPTNTPILLANYNQTVNKRHIRTTSNHNPSVNRFVGCHNVSVVVVKGIDMTQVPQPLLLTVKEVAKLLRIHRPKVYDLIKAGTIEGFKLGSDWRVKRESVEKLIGEIPEDFFASSKGAKKLATPGLAQVKLAS